MKIINDLVYIKVETLFYWCTARLMRLKSAQFPLITMFTKLDRSKFNLTQKHKLGLITLICFSYSCIIAKILITYISVDCTTVVFAGK